jgi:hypothetical protein
MDILKVLNFIKDNLPHSLDMKPNGKITPDVHSWGEMGYFINVELILNIVYSPLHDCFEVNYYAEDDETYHFMYTIDEKTTIKDLREMFKECFNVSLVYFLRKEKELIKKIREENEN